MTWLSSSGRGASFGGFSGEHGANERAHSVERPKESLRDRFWPNPGFNKICRYSPYRIFLKFCGRCNRGGSSLYRIFCFVGYASQVDPSAWWGFAWRGPESRFTEFVSNGIILVRKNGLIAPFRAQGRCLTQIRQVGDETALKASSCWERALRHSLKHVLAARAYPPPKRARKRKAYIRMYLMCFVWQLPSVQEAQNDVWYIRHRVLAYCLVVRCMVG